MSTSTVKIQYVGDLGSVRMPEGGEYLTKDEAKSPEALRKTVRKGQPIKAEAEVAKALCATKLWKLVEKNSSSKKKGGK